MSCRALKGSAAQYCTQHLSHTRILKILIQETWGGGGLRFCILTSTQHSCCCWSTDPSLSSKVVGHSEDMAFIVRWEISGGFWVDGVTWLYFILMSYKLGLTSTFPVVFHQSSSISVPVSYIKKCGFLPSLHFSLLIFIFSSWLLLHVCASRHLRIVLASFNQNLLGVWWRPCCSKTCLRSTADLLHGLIKNNLLNFLFQYCSLDFFVEGL